MGFGAELWISLLNLVSPSDLSQFALSSITTGYYAYEAFRLSRRTTFQRVDPKDQLEAAAGTLLCFVGDLVTSQLHRRITIPCLWIIQFLHVLVVVYNYNFPSKHTSAAMLILVCLLVGHEGNLASQRFLVARYIYTVIAGVVALAYFVIILVLESSTTEQVELSLGRELNSTSNGTTTCLNLNDGTTKTHDYQELPTLGPWSFAIVFALKCVMMLWTVMVNQKYPCCRQYQAEEDKEHGQNIVLKKLECPECKHKFPVGMKNKFTQLEDVETAIEGREVRGRREDGEDGVIVEEN